MKEIMVGNTNYMSTSPYMYRYHDDTIIFDRPCKISAGELLRFIQSSQARKAELEPDGYWKPTEVKA